MELDREDFRLWLAAKDPDEEVGSAGLSMGCPIARYLHERTGERAYGVGWTDASVPGDPASYIGLPLWARTFVQCIDGSVVTTPKRTAKQALTILDSVDLPTS